MTLPARLAKPPPISPLALTSYLTVIPGTAVLCIGVAVLLWLMVPPIGQHGFINVLVHSELIGVSIAFLTLFVRKQFEPFGAGVQWLQILILPAAALLAYLIGSVAARLILGLPVSLAEFFQGNVAIASLVTSAVITVACTWFFVSRAQLDSLKLQAAEEERRAISAQLAMLRAQVEPHMLFNTLANLRALIAVDPDRAVLMLDRLNDFLRTTLDSSRNDSHSLADEFASLENYLALMKIRLGERLAFTLALPAAMSAIEVPSMLLQPVLENSIRHGIEPAVDGGEITVTASLDGSDIVIEVRDTGVGMQAPTPTVTSSPPSSAPLSQGGFGLFSLRERLALRSANETAVSIVSPLAGGQRGTCVTIRMLR